jgi:peptidoglycan/LPS O-acetylase OafA/YrhL
MPDGSVPLSTAITPAKNYFPALTGVRAIAAWMVFFYHLNPFAINSIGYRLVGEFYIGVALFFVLSGLLICLRYLDRIEFKKHWMKRYFRNRVARIYPMYLLITCLTFAASQLQASYDQSGYWQDYGVRDKLLVFGLNITFLRGFFDQFKFSGVAAGWTLTVEECFYFLAPVLLLGLRTKPLKLVLYALVLPAIGALLVTYAPHRYGFFGSYTFLFRVTFFGRCLEFLAGMGLALFLFKQGNKASKHAIYTWGGVIWIASVVGLMAWADNPALPEKGTLPVCIFLNNVVLVPGLCALFYGLIREQSSLSRLLGSKAFELLGKASYTFYLIHQGILSRFLELHISSNVIIKFLLINLVAIVLFKLVEEPLHKWLTGHYKRQQMQLA